MTTFADKVSIEYTNFPEEKRREFYVSDVSNIDKDVYRSAYFVVRSPNCYYSFLITGHVMP